MCKYIYFHPVPSDFLKSFKSKYNFHQKKLKKKSERGMAETIFAMNKKVYIQIESHNILNFPTVNE